MDAITGDGQLAQQEATALFFQPVPEETAVPMPMQDLHRWDRASQVWQTRPPRTARLRRALVFTATLALTAAASYEMYRVLSVHRMTPLQVALLLVFTITFVWIALPCVCGLAGLIALWRGRSVSGMPLPPQHPTPTLTTRTALLMPIYNEDPSRIFAGLQAIYEALEAIGALEPFDFFLLSDTTDPDVWLEEERGFLELRRRTGGETRIFYRHRSRNTRRKAGNIADFCQRWGAQYDHMVILDADSLMTGETLVRLAAAMEAQPEVGLIQTLPLVVNRHTLFARAQQFAASMYGPVIAAGVAYWHLSDSSYWGHNAIIRTKAFMHHAGLPDLAGRPPFGGHILSHDFVEAALLRRAGWKVYLVPEITGSYEESPPSLIDFAARDRRWCQGNLQHSRIVLTRGLHWMSRVHLTVGIMSYLASLLWLVFIALGFLLALQAHFLRPEYFPKGFALFPTWPVFDPVRAVRLFVGTMAVLVAPKGFGYLLLCKERQRARRCGGWRAIVRRHLPHTLFGVVLAGAAYTVSPPFLIWMSPVVLGLLLAIPVSSATGRPQLGRAVRRLGLLVTPEETEPPAVLERANALARDLTEQRPQVSDALERLAGDAELRTLHAAMLPPQPERNKGEYDVDLLLGLAKLGDVHSLKEASVLLSSREKLTVLGSQSGFARLCQLATA